ncbi:MAG: two-component regulator propeller domain-containing protein [Cyclobacteriaceae bacterium]
MQSAITRYKILPFLASLLLLMLFAHSLKAQKPQLKFGQLGLQHGLPEASILSLHQDQEGFLWIGTREGLQRYDGYSFQGYRHDPADSSSISSNYVSSIHEDLKGSLWIGTQKGVNRFDKRSEQYQGYLMDSSNIASIDNVVKSVYCDRDGMIWVGTQDKLFRLDPETEILKSFKPEPSDPTSLSGNAPRPALEDPNGMVWIITGSGLNRFDPKTEQFTHYLPDPSDTRSGSNNIWCLFEDRNSKFWVGTDEGLYRFDQGAQKFYGEVLLSGEMITSIAADQTGWLWIVSSESGLVLLNPDSGEYYSYPYDSTNPYGLPNSGINDIYMDRQGIVWLGMYAHGLYSFDQGNSQFKHYWHQPGNPNSLNDNIVYGMIEDREGILWIGTRSGGLNRYDPNTGQFRHFLHNPLDPSSLDRGPVWSIYEDSQSKIWINTPRHNQFDRETGKFKKYRHDPSNPNSISGDGYWPVLEDRNDIFWMASANGINRFDPTTETFKHYLPNKWIRAICEDYLGFLWLGTRKGELIRFDPSTLEHKQYLFDSSNPNSVNNYYIITCFLESQDSTLWIGTFDGGVHKFDRETKSFIHYTEKEGLVSNSVLGILEDGKGYLWISTVNGLVKFDPETVRFYNYDVHDGLQGNEFKTNAFYKSSQTGKMYFGGTNGFNVFHPDSIKDNSYIPPVVFTGFRYYNRKDRDEKPKELKGISAIEEVTLGYNENMFTCEFAALNYSNPFKNQYAYSLEGVTNNWIQLGTKRELTFTNLSPGTYTLKVKGSNNNGIWNETGTSIKITITPPWWQTWWAYGLYAILFAGSILGYINLKTGALKRERERLLRVDKLKDDFLANTSHELRTPLNGIIGIAESLMDGVAGELSEKVKSNLDLVAGSGRRLSSLVNSILDFSKLKTHNIKLHLMPMDLRSMAQVVLQMSEPLIAGKELVLKNEISKAIPSVIADENRLQQILHNLVGNAIKFTETGKISISASEQDRMVQISVTDTGTGIPEDKIDLIFKEFEQVDTSTTRQFVGSGLGLSITKKLIELHGGTIGVTSKVGMGSTFTFTLPVSKEQPSVLSSTLKVAKVKTPGNNKILPNLKEDQKGKAGEIKVLVVDDEPINQKVLANHLAFGNYKITSALNGELALKAIENEEKFDMVLLDIMMPKMSGFEVCRKIREQYLPSELPVIMITAKDQVSDLVEGLTSGANDYLTKPFSKDEFMARLKTHLNLFRINSTAGKFVPYEFLKALGRESLTDVNLGDHVQGEVTVFFSDIRAYSTLSEAMTPEQNFKFLNAYLRRVGPIIKRHNGFINQFMGDGTMALFQHSAKDALLASIEIKKVVTEYNVHRQEKGRTSLEVGIGIHTGPLMLGIIGDEERMDAGVVSDTVNISSRMEGLTKHFGASVVVSQNTLAKLSSQDEFSYRPLGKVQVKGRKQTLTVYEFYDGDPKESILRKRKTKADFEEGLKLYFQREFTQAAILFNKVLETISDDKTAKIYLKRCAENMVQGVSDNWTGVEMMLKK